MKLLKIWFLSMTEKTELTEKNGACSTKIDHMTSGGQATFKKELVTVTSYFAKKGT